MNKSYFEFKDIISYYERTGNYVSLSKIRQSAPIRFIGKKSYIDTVWMKGFIKNDSFFRSMESTIEVISINTKTFTK